MKVTTATASHVGNVRDSNQDRASRSQYLCAVADGMGGHAGGEKAASMAIAELSGARGTLSPERLVGVIEAANRRIYDAAGSPSLRGMGTTVVVAVFDPGSGVATILNVGDSRGYLLRDGQLTQITIDHSLVDELVRQGQISEAEAEIHPQRNIVTRALGIGPDIEVDTFSIQIQPDDRLLLASDGLSNEVTVGALRDLLGRGDDAQTTADALVAAALQAGGRDNITVALMDFASEETEAAAVTDEVVAEVGGAGHEAVPDAGERSEDIVAEVPRPRKRRLPFRSMLLLLAVVAVLAVAGGGLSYYGQSGYYADEDGDFVGIYRGRPGGLLWMKPSLEQTTEIRTDDLDGASRRRLEQRPVWPSAEDARDFVDNLEQLSDQGS